VDPVTVPLWVNELNDGQVLTDEVVLRDVFTQYVDVLPERLEEMKLGAAD
jgi:hypothetical protein